MNNPEQLFIPLKLLYGHKYNCIFSTRLENFHIALNGTDHKMDDDNTRYYSTFSIIKEDAYAYLIHLNFYMLPDNG